MKKLTVKKLGDRAHILIDGELRKDVEYGVESILEALFENFKNTRFKELDLTFDREPEQEVEPVVSHFVSRDITVSEDEEEVDS